LRGHDFIWTLPDGDCDFSTRWMLIKRSVSRFSEGVTLDFETRNESARKHRESTIWQRRFWEHCIRDELDNPVRHGYVRRVVDWPFSTFHRYVRQGVYPSDWGGGDDSDWGNFE
jgi:putative transposase